MKGDDDPTILLRQKKKMYKQTSLANPNIHAWHEHGSNAPLIPST